MQSRSEHRSQLYISCNASPKDHTAAPNRTISFSRNCPGTTESAGNPPRLDSQPGVENKKLKVVRNIMTASALPNAETLAEKGRSAIMKAIAISVVPSRLENPWILQML